MLRLYYDHHKRVKIASTSPITTNIYKYVEIDRPIPNPIGKKIIFRGGNQASRPRVAVICNWDDACGIATYTKYLVDSLGPHVDNIKIFSESTPGEKLDGGYDVSYCWKRGEPMRAAVRQVLDWQPSVVIVQHEYGIFPKASYLLQMLQDLEDTPYVVTMHSVYEHLDKTVSSGSMKNIIVHTHSGKECLKRLGNKNNVWVIPHGCVVYDADETSELWNTWQTPYPIVQFGFGFSYKGVDIALEAIALLKKRQPSKYRDIFYTYFCSENKHVRHVINDYYQKMMQRVRALHLEDNVAIIRGFQSDQTLNNCLRSSRLAIFPYVTDPRNVVYGASGAIRLAMANGGPVIASASRMFDDMEGVLPRPKNAEQLAEAIDHVFSNEQYRQGIISRASGYVRENSWGVTASRYMGVLQQVCDDDEDVIYV